MHLRLYDHSSFRAWAGWRGKSLRETEGEPIWRDCVAVNNAVEGCHICSGLLLSILYPCTLCNFMPHLASAELPSQLMKFSRKFCFWRRKKWHLLCLLLCHPFQIFDIFLRIFKRVPEICKYVIGARLLELWAYKRGDARRKERDLCFAHSLVLCTNEIFSFRSLH